MENLTSKQLSDLLLTKAEEDIEMSEADGYDIEGLTAKGMEYINILLHKPSTGEKVSNFFKEFDKVCNKVVDSGAVRLTGGILLPLLGLLI